MMYSFDDISPSTIFGTTLLGDKIVRFIYMDEAGINPEEPVTVVTGVILDADQHMIHAERLILEAMRGIPKEILDKNLPWSAKLIFHGDKYREEWKKIWPLPNRLRVLGQLMQIPRKLNAAISLGLVRRDNGDETYKTTPFSKAQFDHIFAFRGCIGFADSYIRQRCGHSEIGAIIAEDHVEMRKYLASLPKTLQKPFSLPSTEEYLHPTVKEKEQGYIEQAFDMRCERIRKTILFIKKEDDPLMLLSDVCAFGMRRYFSELSFGDIFIKEILGGNPPNLEDYKSASSYNCFRFHT